MKKTKIQLNKRLFLNKETISNLDRGQEARVLGGGFTQDATGCDCTAPAPTIMVACPPNTNQHSCFQYPEGGCVVFSYPRPTACL